MLHYQRLFVTVTVSPKDKKYTEVKSASECANKCDNEKNLQCKSFNYCRNESVCYLSENHLFDSTASTGSVESLICDHYSSEFQNNLATRKLT